MNAARGAAGRTLEAVLLAVMLALASVIPVAWALEAAPSSVVVEEIAWHPLGTSQALVLALGAVIPAGVLGGLAGALVWARRRVVAPFVALAVAWAAGVIALPIVAGAFDIPLRTGTLCLDGCEAVLNSEHPLSGFAAYAWTVLTWPFSAYLLIVPAILFYLARAFRRSAVWVAAWLSLHAALHVFPILRSANAAIYGLLLVGVVLWAAWLWARDAGVPVARGTARRWALAIVPLAILVATSWALAAWSWLPAVPRAIDEVVIGTAELDGFNPRDPGEWLDPTVVPRTPSGKACLAPIVRPAGTLELCWEGHRDYREDLPGADRYQFRLLATLHNADPTAWVSITIQPVVGRRALVNEIWPSGAVDGPCRTVAVNVEGWTFTSDRSGSDVIVDDVVCGRTISTRTAGWASHHAIWTCGGCGATSPGGRQIALRSFVDADEGVIPTWTISAAIGR